MTRPRILLADDDPLVREKLKGLLEQRFNVPGAFADGKALVAFSPQLKPDLIVIDIRMPVLGGFEAARQIRRLLPKVKIIFVTVNTNSVYENEARRMGAVACLSKKSAASELIPSIERALQTGGASNSPPQQVF